jgi:hypothetical protein
MGYVYKDRMLQLFNPHGHPLATKRLNKKARVSGEWSVKNLNLHAHRRCRANQVCLCLRSNGASEEFDITILNGRRSPLKRNISDNAWCLQDNPALLFLGTDKNVGWDQWYLDPSLPVAPCSEFPLQRQECLNGFARQATRNFFFCPG